ncbi:hypothetical protein HC766_05645 [Candidatus Gracilibacteria bacterium]|nr:hypothetical protein [Candidatus Gracilibacteria bacterium]
MLSEMVEMVSEISPVMPLIVFSKPPIFFGLLKKLLADCWIWVSICGLGTVKLERLKVLLLGLFEVGSCVAVGLLSDVGAFASTEFSIKLSQIAGMPRASLTRISVISSVFLRYACSDLRSGN